MLGLWDADYHLCGAALLIWTSVFSHILFKVSYCSNLLLPARVFDF